MATSPSSAPLTTRRSPPGDRCPSQRGLQGPGHRGPAGQGRRAHERDRRAWLRQGGCSRLRRGRRQGQDPGRRPRARGEARARRGHHGALRGFAGQGPPGLRCRGGRAGGRGGALRRQAQGRQRRCARHHQRQRAAGEGDRHACARSMSRPSAGLPTAR